MFRLVLEEVAWPQVVGQGFASAILRGRQRIVRIGRAREETLLLLPLMRDLFLVDEGNGDRFVRTGLYASRRFSDRQPTRAHVALADDAPLLGILRHVVGGIPKCNIDN